MHHRRAVTLIELLVVLSIVALLFALSFPALARSRADAWKAKSLANLRSIGQAAAGYQLNNRGALPLLLLADRGQRQGNPRNVTGWCVWSGWGAWCQSQAWSNSFDSYPMHRPLNDYLVSSINMGSAPSSPPTMTDSRRTNLTIKALQDPSDRIGHQQRWPAENDAPALPCFVDVGTSYLWQAKWWAGLADRADLTFVQKFEYGLRQMSQAATFIPSRFVWAADESFTLVSESNDPTFSFLNGYRERNRGLALFLDGHSADQAVVPGPDVEAYRNERYSLVFDAEHPPR